MGVGGSAPPDIFGAPGRGRRDCVNLIRRPHELDLHLLHRHATEEEDFGGSCSVHVKAQLFFIVMAPKKRASKRTTPVRQQKKAKSCKTLDISFLYKVIRLGDLVLCTENLCAEESTHS